MRAADIMGLAERFAGSQQSGAVALDFSADSLAAVDAAIDDRRRARGKAAAFATEAGCYVGEVIRRQLGGQWREPPAATPRGGFFALFRGAAPAPGPVLDLGVIVLSPIEKVRARLRDTAEDPIEHYYEAVERMIIPRLEDIA